MSLDHRTSEAFTPKSVSSLGKDNVVDFGRIVAVQGRNFQERFMGEVVMPTRQDVAIMALQQILSRATHREVTDTPEQLVDRAFAIADAFCLRAPVTLDAKLLDYFNLYMQRGKLDDILKSQMEAAHDFSV